MAPEMAPGTSGPPDTVEYVTPEATSVEMMAAVKRAIGRPCMLRPYEQPLKVLVQADAVMVFIETYDTQERRRRDTLQRHGVRLLLWSRDPETGRFGAPMSTTSYYSDDSPIDVLKLGLLASPEDARARRIWEDLCHRPGSSRSPMDSSDRVGQGKNDPLTRSTRQMERHWRV